MTNSTPDSIAINDCVHEDDAEKLREILAAGASVDWVDSAGYTVLHRAAAEGKAECLALIARRCAVETFDKAGGPRDLTPLGLAADYGFHECVELLLEFSDAAARSKGSYTPLMLAAASGHPRCVELLIPKGKARARNRAEQTALILAAQAACPRSVELLLECCDLSDPDDSIHEALRELCRLDPKTAEERSSGVECAKKILDAIEACDPDGEAIRKSAKAAQDEGLHKISDFVLAWELSKRERRELGSATDRESARTPARSGRL